MLKYSQCPFALLEMLNLAICHNKQQKKLFYFGKKQIFQV